MGVIFVFIALSELKQYQTYGWMDTYRNTRIHDDSAYVIIVIQLWLGILCLISVFRDYKAMEKLGFYAIEQDNSLNPNEAFRKEFERFTLTFYSWRDLRFYGHSIDYGYRGLYMTMDYKNEKPKEVELIKDLFDKTDEEDGVTIFFKEGWNIDDEDLPRLIRKIYKRLKIHPLLESFKNFRGVTTPQRHFRSTKLDFGKHLHKNKIVIFFLNRFYSHCHSYCLFFL